MNTLIRSTDSFQLSAIESIRDTYTHHAKAFTRFCRDRGESAVTEESVRDYFVWLAESSYKAGTILIKRSAVKKRLRQLAENAPLEMQVKLDRFLSNLDGFGATRAPKVQYSTGDKVINSEERQLLLAKATPRLGYIMEFLWLTGCRISEVINIRLRDCRVDGNRVIVTVTGKRRKEREVKITVSLYERLRAFYRGEEFLFETQKARPYTRTYVTGRIQTLGRRVLGRTIGAHSYRHSFATRMIRQTNNLKGVSEYLGHANTSTTSMMYDHNMLSDADLLEESLVCSEALKTEYDIDGN